MTDDLVFRLKQMEEFFYLDYHCIKKIGREAANRIENLEAELHHCFHRIEELQAALRKITGNGNATGCNPQIMCDIARKALDAE